MKVFKTHAMRAAAYFAMALSLGACDESSDYPTPEQLSAMSPYQIYELGKDYFQGLTHPIDSQTAVELYIMAADRDCPQAAYAVADMYRTGHYLSRDFKKATKYYKIAADSGITEAMYELGHSIIEPNGLIVSKDEALNYLEEAAKSTRPKAMVDVAKIYLEGKIVERDAKKAIALLQRAADHKNPTALAELAKIYLTGLYGRHQDVNLGMRFLEIAVAQEDNASALETMGNVYMDGIGVARDETKGLNYLRESAGKGSVQAKYRLGAYNYRLGDYKKALYWWNDAASAGSPHAQERLGFMYDEGIGGPAEPEKAIFWYEKAVAGGNVESRYPLAVLYAKTGRQVESAEKLLSDIKKKAEDGDLGSLRQMYLIYAGKSPLSNEEKANVYLDKIIGSGDCQIMLSVGMSHLQGTEGLRKIDETADKLLESSALSGCPAAMVIVGDRKLAKADRAGALAWYLVASSAHPDAKGKIASLKASKQERKAADQLAADYKKSIAASKAQ